jgi:hypothetical protein
MTTIAKAPSCVIRRNLSVAKGKPIYVRHCKLADADHQEKKRWYAHTFHRQNVICTARAFNVLPPEWRLAILLHEIGHLLAGPTASEAAANEAVEKDSGIKIVYRDGPYGENLERINVNQVEKARKYAFGGAK